MEDMVWSHRSVRLAVKAKTWLPTQCEWMLAAQCIQSEEKERIGKFVFKKDAKSAMVGRLLIRYAASFMMGIPCGEIKLARTDKGKPYLLNLPNGKSPSKGCNFNISHQGDYVALAAESQRLVGIDVMKVEWARSTTIQEFFRTMQRQLTSNEWLTVQRQAGDMEQLKVFYRLWCLKESYVKALGVGIGFDLSRLNFDISKEDIKPGMVTSSTMFTVDGKPAEDWVFEETMLEDHCVTVATKLQVEEPARTLVQGSELGMKGSAFTVWSVQDLLSVCEPLAGTVPDLLYWNNFRVKDEEPQVLRQ